MASFKLKLRLFLSNLMLFLLFFFATAFSWIECGNRFRSTLENIGRDYFVNKRLHNLHKAIESKNPKEVKTLLERLKPDQVDLLNKAVDDKTPLGHAITQVTSPNQEDNEKQDAQQVLRILAQNEFVEINKTSESGVTSLILALGAEDPLAAENVAVILFESTISSNTEGSLSRKLNVRSIDPDTGNTPLHIASERGLEKVVRLLVTNFKGEIELNAKNEAGKTPLDLALSKDDLAHKAIVDLLLEVLNIDLSPSDSQALLSRLLQQEGIDNPDQEVSPSLLELAYERKNQGLGKFLLTHFEDKVFDTNTDSNIFHQAAKSGNADMIDWIVNLRPDIDEKIINVQNKDGQSPLHLAINKVHENVVEALLRFKHIDVNARVRNSPEHFTPLIIAVSKSYEAPFNSNIVELLLKAPGINIDLGIFNKESKILQTALHVALEVSILKPEFGLEILKLLVQSNANVNLDVPAHNNGFLGGSILHWLVFHNEIKAVEVILKSKNIDLSTKNKAGQSALDVAKEKGYTKIVDLINKKLSGK